MCLVFAGQPLEPLRTLSSYNIQNESILTAVVEDPPVQFYVQCQVPVGVVYGRCWDTIGDLKAHLEARTSRPHLHLGIPVDQQRLTLADRTRDLDEDDKTLADYNIWRGKRLAVALAMSFKNSSSAVALLASATHQAILQFSKP